MENIPSIQILKWLTWKKSSCIFHVCMTISNSMENKPKFKPDPKLKLLEQMGKVHIDAFLSHLATQGRVSASTQKQALNAIIFLYRHVLDQPIEDQLEPVKARRHVRPPTVMTQSEVGRVMAQMAGTHLLMAKILYGCGLRLMECVRLRVLEIPSVYSFHLLQSSGLWP